MSIDIAPGTTITVKVTKQPTNAAAAKTLVRILSKSEDAKAEDKRLTSLRKKHYTPGRRGGRWYSGRMPKLRPLKGDVGEQGTILASPDVIRDLGSVERFVEIAEAK